jgi:cell wall-associated NlpC family hydrolase
MSGKLLKRSALVLGTAMLGLLPLAGTANATTLSLEVKAMNVAHTKLGDWYSWGATGPNEFDCSGLVYYSYKREGKTLNRTAQAQYNEAQKISYSNRRPGDLVFYGYGSYDIFHVGIYIGVKYYDHAWRSMMIAAPQPGERVDEEPVYGSWWNGVNIYFGRIN